MRGRPISPLLDKSFPELLPGAGFGDGSHPTTRLCLSLLPNLERVTTYDIGCGCGILSLAALKLGASEAYITDIDPEALLHAKKCRPSQFDPPHISFTS